MSPVELGPTKVTPPPAGWGYGLIQGLPLDGEVTSPFGPRPPIWTPQGWTSDFHSGIDLWRWNIAGTPILAPAPCLVKASYADSAGGQTVAVEYDDGTGGMFIHMEGIQIGVGNRVERGGMIGLVGSSGLSTAPHLHYMRMRFCGNGPTWYAQSDLIDPLSPEGGFTEVISDPDPAPLPDVVEGDWPAPGQAAIVSTNAETTAEYVAAQAVREGRSLASIWMVVDGLWKGYLVGAPGPINAAFPSPIPQFTALYVRASG